MLLSLKSGGCRETVEQEGRRSYSSSASARLSQPALNVVQACNAVRDLLVGQSKGVKG